MTMTPDLDRFFAAYTDAYNRSLGDRVDHDAIVASFADCFVAAGPGGVNCGKNDDSFRTALDQGFAFYKSIGTRKMSVRRVDVTPIDALHHMAKVHYRADYQKRVRGRRRDGRLSPAWADGLTPFEGGGRVWLRSTGRRVKNPLPLHSGLRLRVHRGWSPRAVSIRVFPLIGRAP
jgi:hypothetical protein